MAMVERKVKIQVYIDPDLAKRLKRLIKMKYEDFYGALSQEVSDALSHWIGDNEASLDVHTKMHTTINPRVPMVHTWLREIVRELGPAVHQVRHEDLERAITMVRGSDPRTVDKWISALVKNGYLKIIGLGIFAVL